MTDLKHELENERHLMKKMRSEYESTIRELRNEMAYLKEQFSSQRVMLKDAIDHIKVLEHKVSTLEN